MSTDPRRRRKTAGLVERRELLDRAGIADALDRIAGEILEGEVDPAHLFVVGIRTGGACLAERLGWLLRRRIDREIAHGVIDITLYRDDAFVGMPRPEVGTTRLPGGLEGRHVILVDDVLFTGRTIRSALDEMMDYGRPRCVRLAVLVDRGNRELPIQADHVGVALETGRDEVVLVELTELGEEDRVVLYGRGAS